ncbi:hypothetical protein M434DRAFT_397349 [Hypoxylon sp. CO27-5]|nr:hypothetical protein M434DRAFT_397349 [Hypoxylon sp. CO27-5]
MTKKGPASRYSGHTYSYISTTYMFNYYLRLGIIIAAPLTPVPVSTSLYPAYIISSSRVLYYILHTTEPKRWPPVRAVVNLAIRFKQTSYTKR